jgi:hypothetical protein
MNRQLLSICALLVGFVLGYFVATKLAKNNITMVVRNNRRLMVYPQKGDTINWLDEQLNTVKVKFSRKACSDSIDGNGMVAQCTVNVSAGVYAYSCDNSKCVDPGIGVGSDVIIMGGARKRTTQVADADLPSPDTQTVSCDSSNKVAGDAVTATALNDLEWSTGDGTVGGSWTITVAPGTCSDGSTTLKNGQVCTVKAGATSQTYQISGSSCSAGASGQGTLTIQ